MRPPLIAALCYGALLAVCGALGLIGETLRISHAATTTDSKAYCSAIVERIAVLSSGVYEASAVYEFAYDNRAIYATAEFGNFSSDEAAERCLQVSGVGLCLTTLTPEAVTTEPEALLLLNTQSTRHRHHHTTTTPDHINHSRCHLVVTARSRRRRSRRRNGRSQTTWLRSAPAPPQPEME